MENYLFPLNAAGYVGGKVREALPAEMPLQLLSSADIGEVPAAGPAE